MGPATSGMTTKGTTRIHLNTGWCFFVFRVYFVVIFVYTLGVI